VDPTTVQGRREMLLLFDEHTVVGREVNHSRFYDNMQLKVADARVFSELMRAMAEGMRGAAAQ